MCKKNLFLSLFFIFFMFSINIYAKTEIYGDLNEDSKITTTDCSILERHILGSSRLPENLLKYADVNGNGTLTSTDISLIERLILGVISEFPVSQTIKWETYYLSKDQVSFSIIPDLETYSAKLKISLPNSGYRIVSKGTPEMIPIMSSIHQPYFIKDLKVEKATNGVFDQSIKEEIIEYNNLGYGFSTMIALYQNNDIISQVRFDKPKWENYIPTSDEIEISTVPNKNDYTAKVNFKLPNQGYKLVSKGQISSAPCNSSGPHKTSYNNVISEFIIQKVTVPNLDQTPKNETLTFEKLPYGDSDKISIIADGKLIKETAVKAPNWVELTPDDKDTQVKFSTNSETSILTITVTTPYSCLFEGYERPSIVFADILGVSYSTSYSANGKLFYDTNSIDKTPKSYSISYDIAGQSHRIFHFTINNKKGYDYKIDNF